MFEIMSLAAITVLSYGIYMKINEILEIEKEIANKLRENKWKNIK